MPTIGRELVDGNKLQCGVNIDFHCLAKRMKDTSSKSLVKPQGQESTITKTQVVCSIGGKGTPIIESHI
jgi:hypothetical protein